MGLDHKKLQRALWRYYHAQGGHGAWKELGDLSGYHPSGLSRTAKGLQNATYETWMKLHKAVPDTIPPPVEADQESQSQPDQLHDKNPRYHHPDSERIGIIIADLERTGDTHYITRLCHQAEDFLEFRNIRNKIVTLERKCQKCTE